MNTPMANAESMQIGTVDFVSPDEIKVLLDLDAPHDVALNSGVPRPFPRINSYVLVAGEGGFLVSQIEWITIERSQFPKRRGMQDFGVIDLPYPLRKMSVVPLGVLRESIDEGTKNTKYEFARGIEIFPTVGDPVLIPTQNQLKAIVESGSNRRVNIGISLLAGNAVVSVDPDRLFGRHLAVLGNTGGGKSCSVAGLIRWSVESAQKHNASGNAPNTRFIILDPNGEYRNSFKDMKNVRVYGAEKNDDKKIEQLKVPIWLWNTDEWAAFVQASSKAQKPTLVQALRSVRDQDAIIKDTPQIRMKSYLKDIMIHNQGYIINNIPWNGGGPAKGYQEFLNTCYQSLELKSVFSDEQTKNINLLKNSIQNVINTNTGKASWPKFPVNVVESLQDAICVAYKAFGGEESDSFPIDADAPRPFLGEDFLRSIEINARIMDTSSHIETMLLRVKTLLADAKLKPVICSGEEITLENWLDEYICPSDKTDGSITVIDLSLLPAEVTHIITSVMARLTLEALQRYRRMNDGNTLPTVLVMEEAHTFIKRYSDNAEDENATSMCTRVFEKIAREGRKYGLGLVLSSQRPSELSPTVISQCNSFLLHRLSNDRDQELVNKLVPDNLRGLLRELPSLPSRTAILLGWASELPVIVRMNYLDKQYRPESDDPEYWNVWTREERRVKWQDIAAEWQNCKKTPQTMQTETVDESNTEA